MQRLFRTMLSELDAGRDTVLVSVIASAGSTPRGAGAHMLVSASGRLCGTVGGGAVELRAEQLAMEALADKRSSIHTITLCKNEIEDLGMVCGGNVTVHFCYISCRDRRMHAVASRALALFDAGEESWLLTDLEPGASAIALFGAKSGLCGADVPQQLLSSLAHCSEIVEAQGRQYCAEPLVRAGRVYIFGGGHVAQALVPCLAAVQFRCVVLEDRRAFCRPELFPGAEETRLLDMSCIGRSVQVTPADYICIMTRGHKDDMAAQAFAMRTPARYIGVIGSRRKTAAVTARLQADYGFADADFRRVATPIGMDIGAETPSEIAVSVAAQLIAVRAGKL